MRQLQGGTQKGAAERKCGAQQAQWTRPARRRPAHAPDRDRTGSSRYPRSSHDFSTGDERCLAGRNCNSSPRPDPDDTPLYPGCTEINVMHHADALELDGCRPTVDRHWRRSPAGRTNTSAAATASKCGPRRHENCAEVRIRTGGLSCSSSRYDIVEPVIGKRRSKPAGQGVGCRSTTTSSGTAYLRIDAGSARRCAGGPFVATLLDRYHQFPLRRSGRRAGVRIGRRPTDRINRRPAALISGSSAPGDSQCRRHRRRRSSNGRGSWD